MDQSNRNQIFLACIVACENCLSQCGKNKSCGCPCTYCRDCADLCALLLKWEARGSTYSKKLAALCTEVCNTCATECGRNADKMDCCKACSEACRNCAEMLMN